MDEARREELRARYKTDERFRALVVALVPQFGVTGSLVTPSTTRRLLSASADGKAPAIASQASNPSPAKARLPATSTERRG